MLKKLKRFLRRLPLWIQVTSGLCTILIAMLATWPNVLSFWKSHRSWVGDAYVWMIESVSSDYVLPFWVLAPLVLFALVGIAGLIIIVLVNILPNGQVFHRESYTEDIIEGVKWRWVWNGYGNDIGDMGAFCLKCDAELISGTRRGSQTRVLFCELCGILGPEIDHGGIVEGDRYVLNRVKREIRRRARAKAKASVANA